LSNESDVNALAAMDKLYEFEREPVSEDKLQPGRYFAGLFAGEHVAGTEFVIGAMFVAWGVTAFDVFVGLLLGNLMAVLTWTFICAPIAVRTRLTLYWFLRRVAGPVTTTIYNVLNAFLFCILAGCMITVSASAVRVPFGIPAQTAWIPTDIRFVIVVICVGAVVVTLAILGFKKLAQFAVVCSPWMFLMFIAGAVALLPGLAMRIPEVSEVHSFADFWTLANKAIWTGVAPEGQSSMTFWQVAAFAWICNLAMHGGLSDMALFRYARKSSYGLFSACGMFLGHYLAWICAGVMGAAAALILKTELQNIDSGGVATTALGVSGLIAVVLAGWTTSNPTLYRAGLALQAVTPGWPRWLVTLIAGAATTLIACSPFVFTGLLNFVGYYGLLLMPVGAIAFTEFWIFPRIGFTQYWVAKKKLLVSWPALASWGIAIAVALTLEKTGALHLFFLFVPVWILTTVLYILFAAIAGARESLPELIDDAPVRVWKTEPKAEAKAITPAENTLLWVSGGIALVCLITCFVLPLWVFLAGTTGYDERLALFQKILIVPTLIYFVAGTTFVIKRDAMKTN
jgi:cytosine permease